MAGYGAARCGKQLIAVKVRGRHYHSIERQGDTVVIVDQRRLPHEFVLTEIQSLDAAVAAIRHLAVRGAPLIAVTAAYGLALGLRADPTDAGLDGAAARLMASRPTARNLRWAVDAVYSRVSPLTVKDRAVHAMRVADELAAADIASNRAIGEHGAALLRAMWKATDPRRSLNVVTHCNTGWLACVDWGTALAAVYAAYDEGVPLHVWVDESRPVNQGARLTTWELAAHGVPYTLQVDAACGSLLRTGRVDACLVGADRVTAGGDVCNKVGTYMVALAAHDNGVPFYVALPSSTFDSQIATEDIEIEDRDPTEVTHVWGLGTEGRRTCVQVAPDGTPVVNPAFDITPSRLVTAFITERGVFAPVALQSALRR